MKVNVSVGGLWHAPAILQALSKEDALQKFYTSRPYFKLPESIKKLGRSHVKAFGYMDLLQALSIRTLHQPFQVLKAKLFDEAVSKTLVPSDIFVAWSSFGVRSLQKAKGMGAITILERGSTHIREQERLLREAYERTGIRYSPQKGVLPEIISREVEEYERADYISIPSTFVVESFIKQGVDPKKLIQIPYGITVRPQEQIKRDWNTQGLEILFVGALGVRKGIPILLEVLKRLAKTTKVHVTFAGQVEEEIKETLAPHRGLLTVKGVVNKAELEALYKTSHILLLPSVEEGMARVILEAMSFGLCPVCSTHTGAGDILTSGEDGFLFEPYDKEKLHTVLSTLAGDREMLQKCGEQAMQKVKQFSSEIYEENILQSYHALLKDRR